MKKFVKYSWMLVLPIVAASAVIWSASAAGPEGKCPEDDPLDHTVLLPNPEDCSSFFSCSNGVPILMHCPDGLYFNDELDVCDWPQAVVREECLPKGSETEITKKTSYKTLVTDEPGWSYEVSAKIWKFEGKISNSAPKTSREETIEEQKTYTCCEMGGFIPCLYTPC